MNELAKRIRELREEKGLSLYQLSKETGISKSALNRWENDKADIRGSYLIVLAKFFNVTTDYLLGLTDFY